MDVLGMAEFASAFAAFVTVNLAIAELVSRRRMKNAEEAIQAYANFLLAQQEIENLVGSAQSFYTKGGELSDQERRSYAKAHMPKDSLLQMLQSIAKESITAFECDKKNGKENAKIILDLTENATNVVLAVKTFYQAVIEQENSSFGSGDKVYLLILQAHEKMDCLNKRAAAVLRDNLKSVNKTSSIYVGSLILSSILFLCICFVFGQLN